ncbi:1-acyl-sn-glycerol-3-phosphate acyltransferase [Coralloluteibacterium stylophorae]|uniref:1-acyl-sn-glycerol-3-phosphate acyltransferase n=2 Tax=Coralloluteibacterium stylophorae TaxID=1776034 RepID=A0A8J8AYT9_9GAMM|nr:lysophospholipid acyltransferase family protein [Coralloluteibacterium stylophorae]MBS7457382.1 1-acyl-sn-glycerol-3-phosphate acyltransferase [Coralloluteibacterium stylophorae]
MHASTSASSSAPDRLRPLRYVLRTPLLLVHVLVALPVTLLLINPLTARWRLRGERMDHRVIRLWSAGLLRIFGLRTRRIGTPLPGAALFVANHVTWIDITLMHSQRVVGFVAKDEISRWPLIGWLARRGGTIYHRRGDTGSLSGVMEQMVARMQGGAAVGVFPEGRTRDGSAVGVFHARIFQPAVLAAVPAQPVALKYGRGGSAQTVVAFQPGENFLQNFLRLLGEPVRDAEVHFLAPVAASEDGRRRMAESCRARIVEAMEA